MEMNVYMLDPFAGGYAAKILFLSIVYLWSFHQCLLLTRM